MRRLRVLLLLAPVIATVAAPVAVAQEYEPKADAAAIVSVGRARFTILTPQLVRLEWTPASYERAADGTTAIRIGPVEGRTLTTVIGLSRSSVSQREVRREA